MSTLQVAIVLIQLTIVLLATSGIRGHPRRSIVRNRHDSEDKQPWEPWSCCTCGFPGVRVRKRANDMSLTTIQISHCDGEPCDSYPGDYDWGNWDPSSDWPNYPGNWEYWDPSSDWPNYPGNWVYWDPSSDWPNYPGNWDPSSDWPDYGNWDPSGNPNGPDYPSRPSNPPSGTWNSWGEWGSCSTACGGGERVRTRECSTGRKSDCINGQDNNHESYDYFRSGRRSSSEEEGGSSSEEEGDNSSDRSVWNTEIEECNKVLCPDYEGTITNDEMCGLDNNARITNGQDANLHQFPWMALLYMHGAFICTGSILDHQHVITAAHCVFADDVSTENPRSFTVYTGSSMSSRADRSFVEKVEVPIKRFSVGASGDIAILKLRTPLQFSPTRRPVCLPSHSIRDTKTNCSIMGWGQTSTDDFRTPDNLLYAPVSTIPNAECAGEVGDEGLNYRNHLCAGGKGKDVCYGDSGGPLMCFDEDSKRYVQHGVVSFGYGDQCEENPGIFTDVAKYIKWIKKVSGDSTVSVE